jgi:hypothetical protein
MWTLKMKDRSHSNRKIEDYVAGRHMVVDGEKYIHDLKIIGHSVKSNWWRREGHRLSGEDIKDILSASPDVLVVGTGYAGAMQIPDGLRRHLEKKYIRMISEPTAKAVQTFNRMRAEGKNVSGAFHLTC